MNKQKNGVKMEAVLEKQTIREKNNQSKDIENKNKKIVDDVEVSITYKNDVEPNVSVTDNEVRNYIKRGNMKKPESVVEKLDLVIDGEEVEISYVFAPVNFDRIRRITGYLVGTMDRWNDAKTSEEIDRVKHSVITR